MRIGKAYGFFQYTGEEKELVMAFLPIVKRQDFSQDCTFSLSQIAAFQTQDSALTLLVEEARKCDRTHIIQGSVNHFGNRAAAMLVGDIFNGIYLDFFRQNDPFFAEIVYQRAGIYVFRRK